MDSEILYVNTRAVTSPRNVAGTQVTVSAGTSDGKVVLVQWQRSDRAAQHIPPVQIALGADELRAMVASLDETWGEAE